MNKPVFTIVVADDEDELSVVLHRLVAPTCRIGVSRRFTVLGPETEEDYEAQNRYIARSAAEGADAIVFSAISYAENATSVAARTGVEILRSEHPEINVLVGLNEPLTVGTAVAVQELGLAGQVRMVGFDSNVQCIDLMRDGVVSALIVQNPYAMGYLGVECAWKLLNGETYDAESWLDTATTIVTRENIFGNATRKRGTIKLNGKPYRNRNPRESIKNGFALLTEERRATGIFAIENIRDNTIISNMEAAKVSGVNVFLTTMLVHTLAGALYGFAGFVEAARLGSVTAATGLNNECDAIAACVIGGIVLGVFVLRIIFVALNMLGINPNLQYIIKGAIILAACSPDMRKYLVKK